MLLPRPLPPLLPPPPLQPLPASRQSPSAAALLRLLPLSGALMLRSQSPPFEWTEARVTVTHALACVWGSNGPRRAAPLARASLRVYSLPPHCAEGRAAALLVGFAGGDEWALAAATDADRQRWVDAFWWAAGE
jgi:hypothetical protein